METLFIGSFFTSIIALSVAVSYIPEGIRDCIYWLGRWIGLVVYTFGII